MLCWQSKIYRFCSWTANKISFDSRLRNCLQTKRLYQFSETESSSWSVDRNEGNDYVEPICIILEDMSGKYDNTIKAGECLRTERPWDVYSPEAYHKMNSRDAGLRLPDSVKHTANPSRFMDTVNKSFHAPFFGYSRELAFLFINVFSSNPTQSYIHLFNVYVKLYLQFYRLLLCLIRIFMFVIHNGCN